MSSGGDIIDMLPGKPLFLWISGPSGTEIPESARGREVVLAWNGPIVTAGLNESSDSGFSWRVRPRGDRDDESLRQLIDPFRGVVAVLNTQEQDQRGRTWLRLRAHPYDMVRQWGQPLRVALDDRALDAIRRIADDTKLKTPGAPLDWLRQRTRLGPLPGATLPHRFSALAAPGQDLHEPEPCILLGDNIAVSLARDNMGWRITNVRSHGRQPDERQRLALVHGDLDFVDRSTDTRLRRQVREEVDRLRTTGAEDSFLARWREYHELENRYALRRMREFRYMEYSQYRRLDGPDHVIRFHLGSEETDPDRQEDVLRYIASAVRAGEELELECAAELPDVLGGSKSTGLEGDVLGLLDVQAERGNETGIVQSVDVDSQTLDLRISTRDSLTEGVGPSLFRRMPPRSGFLHAAVGGDRRRLQRRAEAIKRVQNEDIPLPQLHLLLQGKLERGHQRRRIKPYSEAAWACFKGTPTESQKLALDVALNTPDIAVVQGPPGTGKTQLIAALQTRLAEEGKGHAVVSRSMLLTSFQHAAVDNLVERSKVWDLPAIKVDSRNRGSTAHISAWRAEAITALDGELRGSMQGRRTLALREIARQAGAYTLAPVAAEEVPALLERVAAHARGLISDALMDDLDRLRTSLEVARRVASLNGDPRRETTLRAIRGLRCTPTAFADDGPLMASAVLTRLRHLGSVEDKDRELLDRAADWVEGDVPPFLPELVELRSRLIDQMIPVQRLARPAVRQDVVDLLIAIVEDLEDRLGSSAEGVDQVLADYLDDLRGNPIAVHHTLRLYTTSLATTCQQADSRGLAAAKDAEGEDVLFDTVIVDEAARANPLDLLIPLTKATRRIVLVGDHQQLPHMLEPDVERGLEEQRRTGELTMLRRSVFEQLFTLLRKDPDKPGRTVRLGAQFRMHRVLGDFVSRNFYDKTLESPRPDKDFVHALDGYHGKPAAWLSLPNGSGGEVPGRSKTRPVEARAIAKELKRLALERRDLTFGVISFYAAQVQRIWLELERQGLAVRSGREYRPVEALLRDDRNNERVRLQVGTVDAFQGKEFDVAFLSVTRSRPVPEDVEQKRHTQPDSYAAWVRETYGHLVLRNRMCVAMSRQQRLLVVVGDDQLFEPSVAPDEVEPLMDFRRMCLGGTDGTVVR
ncbi:AAA domain-containing protein [Streptomyces sp. MK7]|uniref:DEAD/DEAH box helicase n=1 Tax=Streptomyces sp. MK7 TaxID=3067635 RepID=UPI002930B43A|nr:AAA domain-containing protein [Streptomyces sp. MK7]